VGWSLSGFESLEAIRTFAAGLVIELRAIQPFELVPAFLEKLLACETRISDGALYNVCGGEKLTGVGYYFDALYQTFAQTPSGSSDAALLVLMLASAAGGLSSYLLWRSWRGHHDGWNLVDVVAVACLTPIASSVAAFFLQLLAIVIFTLFGAAVGLLIFILGYLWWLFLAIGFIRKVRSSAATLRRGAEIIERTFPAGSQPPKPPPPAGEGSGPVGPGFP